MKNLSTVGIFEREIIMTSVTNRRRGFLRSGTEDHTCTQYHMNFHCNEDKWETLAFPATLRISPYKPSAPLLVPPPAEAPPPSSIAPPGATEVAQRFQMECLIIERGQGRAGSRGRCSDCPVSSSTGTLNDSPRRRGSNRRRATRG